MEVSRPHLGSMLALCGLIFRSWAFFFRSWPPLGYFFATFCSPWPFFCFLGPLRARFWRVLGCPGMVLEAPKPYFSRFFVAPAHAMRKTCDKRFVL